MPAYEYDLMITRMLRLVEDRRIRDMQQDPQTASSVWQYINSTVSLAEQGDMFHLSDFLVESPHLQNSADVQRVLKIFHLGFTTNIVTIQALFNAYKKIRTELENVSHQLQEQIWALFPFNSMEALSSYIGHQGKLTEEFRNQIIQRRGKVELPDSAPKGLRWLAENAYFENILSVRCQLLLVEILNFAEHWQIDLSYLPQTAEETYEVDLDTLDSAAVLRSQIQDAKVYLRLLLDIILLSSTHNIALHFLPAAHPLREILHLISGVAIREKASWFFIQSNISLDFIASPREF